MILKAGPPIINQFGSTKSVYKIQCSKSSDYFLAKVPFWLDSDLNYFS